MLDIAFESIARTSPSLEEAIGASELKPPRLIERLAKSTLESHPHFRGRSQWVQIQFRDRCLQLNGKLPSFFLKQLAQEALRQLDGVDRIENQIVVASPHGQLFEPSENNVSNMTKLARRVNRNGNALAILKTR